MAGVVSLMSRTGILQLYDGRTRSGNVGLVCGFLMVSALMVVVGMLIGIDSVYILLAVLSPMYMAINLAINIRAGCKGPDGDEPCEEMTVRFQRHGGVYLVEAEVPEREGRGPLRRMSAGHGRPI